MAKRTKTLVGLDIDATGIVAASVVVNGRVRVERAAFAPLEPGIIRDGEVADVDGLAEALRDAVPREQGPRQARPRRPRQPEDRRARRRPALPRGRQGARRGRALPGAGPASDAARARRARLPAARRHQRRTGRRQRVLLVAARREMVERVLAALRAAGPEARGRRPLRLRHGPRAAPRRPRRRARPVPRHRRPHQPRGRPRHRVHLRPRLGQRRRGPRRRARRARRADARARLRLAGPRRRRRTPVEDITGDRRDRGARPPDPARRRAPDRLRGAQLAGLPPHAGGRRRRCRAR